MPAHALISGAGIAGPALAHQLASRGWRTTVIERFSERRDEGQNVDIRGAAREVVSRMGITDDVRAANTGEIGTRLVTADGTVAASFPVSESARNDGPTAELEILRGELSRILIEHTPGTDYLFDTQISNVTDHGSHVTTVLQDGIAVDADVLVIAEGLHSRSRRFVTSAQAGDLGMYFAYVTVPRLDSDEPWWTWQHATRSRAVHLRPDNLGTTRAVMTFISDVRGLSTLQRADQISILQQTFADAGGAAPRILAQLEAGAPMYFSAVGQVHTPVWSRGRVTLLGDAAFCNATFGGAGTSLALIGAYILAGELAGTGDVPAALTRYQQTMQPFVGTAPRIRPGVLRMANPRSRLGIGVLHRGARIAAAAAGLNRFNTGGIASPKVALPDYPGASLH